MEGKTLGIVVVVLVILVGGWYALSKNETPPVTDVPDSAGTVLEISAQDPVTVRYTDQGFSPATITVPAGTVVTFVNDTSNRMWVGSAMHPDHLVYDGTSRAEHCAATYTGAKPFDQCESGPSYTFVFDKVGTWRYHNHADASDFGSVIVTNS